MNTDPRWLATDLCITLHALASTDAAFAGQSPGYARQLALEFGEAVLKVFSNSTLQFTDAQLHVVNELALLLRQMSEEDCSMWSEGAVKEHPRWIEVRKLAQKALSYLVAQRNSSAEH